ncbi:hypothetical protein FS749_000861 [Ceratobasidium sp. UAMH 11750]|nr:hypothetical protein FS749_000861 [Ceratobasidium sp. UAMH 11750]
MACNTSILGGYCIPKEELKAWSTREAESNPLYKQILDRKGGNPNLAVESYLWRHGLGRLIKQQNPRKAEHGGCGFHCIHTNFIFYRRCATIVKMTNFKPHDWERFKETPADREVKERLENTLNMTLPEWSMVVWGPRAMLYDPTPEMFEERGDELVELLRNGPPGPCGPSQLKP